MKNVLIISLFLSFTAASAAAGELDSKFDGIAAQFARDAGTKAVDLAASPVAVFPYSCDEKLSKKRVDLAVGELLTARLLNAGSFRLVERTQLENVMKEQKLGLSGAIESATAAQVGKLAGARLAVLGTVARVGRVYQISSKFVDTGSAEIISASIVEVPIATFDEEAARYLTLVPEREALGIYAGYSYWPIKTKVLPVLAIPGSAKTLTPVARSSNFSVLTAGVRYQVANRFVLDIAVAPVANLGPIIVFDIPGVETPTGTMDGMGARISLNRTSSLSSHWRALYGLGYQIYGISFFSEGTGSVYVNGIGGTRLDRPTGGANFSSIFARGGLEWRPKERFGWSLLGQLNQPQTISCKMKATTAAGAVSKLKVMELDLPVFTVDTAFSFYF